MIPTVYPEECLLDFIELHGAHTGKNMANAVFKSLKEYRLLGKVEISSSFLSFVPNMCSDCGLCHG
jgi:hypothetical protein